MAAAAAAADDDDCTVGVSTSSLSSDSETVGI